MAKNTPDLIGTLVKQEGGTSAAAKLLGVSLQRIANWKEDGRTMSEGTHLRLWLALNHPTVLKAWRRERVLEELK